jgi:PKD repeat protein
MKDIMNILLGILKSLTIIGLGIISTMAAPDRDAYAGTAQSYRYSAKCNEFTFDATRSLYPAESSISFLWDFGDGTTSTEPVATHTYARSGDYTVNLSVTDNSGLECTTAVTSQTVRVNIPPKITLTGEDWACVNKPINLEAQTSPAEADKKLRYAWNFGDGSRSEADKSVKKAYSKGGKYRVILTVDDYSASACGNRRRLKLERM